MARPCCWRVPCHQYIIRPKVELAQSNSGHTQSSRWGSTFGHALPPRVASSVMHMAKLWEFNRKSLLLCRREAVRFQVLTACSRIPERATP